MELTELARSYKGSPSVAPFAVEMRVSLYFVEGKALLLRRNKRAMESDIG